MILLCNGVFLKKINKHVVDENWKLSRNPLNNESRCYTHLNILLGIWYSLVSSQKISNVFIIN